LIRGRAPVRAGKTRQGKNMKRNRDAIKLIHHLALAAAMAQ
jgi:hypothetical protein